VLVVIAAVVAAWLVFRDRAGPVAPAPATPVQPSQPALEPAPAPAPPASPAAAGFVDERSCAPCHADEVAAWTGSDHDLAMQAADEHTVLGDFADARFEDQSGATRFFRSGAEFHVETTGPDGKPAEFPVPYVFGVDPLQQLLLPLSGGRLQALAVAWDARAKRWFSLYPDERIAASDELHWTGPGLNWNFSCAECHATGLERRFDVATGEYHTRWHSLEVGCQACHGPAEKHVAWALGDADDSPGHGFDAPIGASSTTEVEACARCHARRAPLGDGFDHRHRLMDDYLPARLSEGLYFAAGQIQDEVYEYGSFLQSKMHARGVRCSDCHEPHGLGLRAEGNLACTKCHSPTPNAPEHVDARELKRAAYDSPAHHFHEPGKPGSACVDCHMPTRTYMIVDARRDHSLRVPRPDLDARLGTPDACTGCHADRDAAWAAAEIERRFGPAKRPAHYGEALHAGRTGRPGAADALLALAASSEPPIVRASALELLLRYPSREALTVFAAGARDPDPLVRHAACEGFELLGPDERLPDVAPLLSDATRAVRIEAARLLGGVPDGALPDGGSALRAATAEREAAQRALCDRPEGHLNLAQMLLARGDATAAEAELRTALRLDARFAPAWVNLAELVRTVRAEPEAEALLREGLGSVAGESAAPLRHALGLALVRQQKKGEALEELRRATELAPREARFGYVYAVALHDAGRGDEARSELRRVLTIAPWERDARLVLAQLLEENGDAPGAARERAALAAINPHDPALEGATPASDR
jgi:Flp pilus assembly protein TadD